jgi:hypothetical protein
VKVLALERIMLKSASAIINKCLNPFGIKIVRNGHDWHDTKNFIPCAETIENARRNGCSVGDYIDGIMNKIPGATEATIRGMVNLGVFEKPINTIVEIGPGSGRYLEKTIAHCAPERYEIYETSAPWAAYLKKNYDVIQLPTDGRSLSSTPDNSVDLVQAHKVFSGIPSLPTFGYWKEMSRVCQTGGFVVFDILTEACLKPEILRKWIYSSIENGAYPAAIPKEIALSFFKSEHFDFKGSFFAQMGPGFTEVLVFQKLGNLIASIM